MTKLKITTLLLALTVVAATGCSNNSSNTTNSGTPTTSEQSSESTSMTTPDNAATESAESTTDTTGSTESTTSTDQGSSSATANSDLTTKQVAAAIEKQGIKLISKPEEGWTLNNVKPDRYVTNSNAKQAEPVSIYVFKSESDLQTGLKDLEKQVNGVPFRKTEYTKGNVLVIYWFDPDLNKGNTEKGVLDAKIAKAVNSL
ncbi:hypothetical protein [Paenibacillus campi]|uniref:hypothetical protein n=1 Tax=Paenibacillus campi TaxID=3106031 RepID=UPI002AFEA38B|nr:MULTISPECIES: hypothetical protein [unclassified Paenibacillus]